MSRTTEQTLWTLARLREREEQDFADRLTAAHHRLDREQNNLSTIEQYLVEYMRRTYTAASVPQLLREGQRFRLKLEHSVEQQRRIVETARAQAESARVQWAHARSRREAVEKLIGKREDATATRRRRSEQHHADELAARSSGRRADGAESTD